VSYRSPAPRLKTEFDGLGERCLPDRCDNRGTLTVPDPATAARQFFFLASTEAQVRSLRGIEPLGKREINNIARDTADLIIRAHRAHRSGT
jgi:hypothetical protein